MRVFVFLLATFCNGLFAQGWSKIADFPGLERDDGVAVNLNGKLFFGTGLTVGWGYARDFFMLDPGTDLWTGVSPMPDGAQRQYACAFSGPDAFYVFAGDGIGGPLNDLYQYSLASSSWSLMAPKPGKGLFGASCLEFGDKVIIVGGKFQGNDPASAEVWEYTISSNTWIQKNNFPFGGRFRASAAVINDVGYLLFGLDGNNLFRREMYSYDHVNDTWTWILNFQQPLGRAYAALKAVDDKLLLFGGYDSLNVYHKDVWCFKPSSVSWIQQADFYSSGRKGGMSAVAGNKFYYSCGINAGNSRLRETWKTDLPLAIAAQYQDGAFNLYPNPAHEFVQVDPVPEAGVLYTISSATGTYIRTDCSSHGRIDVSGLLPGIYLLTIGSGRGDTLTARFIKD